jgi:AcrR family transcriptional regulator
MRADAQRNRAKLLEAAERTFAERGVEVPTEEIARAAGVGVGTLFRHFPTKEALLEAVLLARMESLADTADRLIASGNPGSAFFEFFLRLVEQSAMKNVLSAALTRAGIDPKDVTGGIRADFRGRIAALLEQAQAAGTVRGDLEVDDVIALLLGLAATAEQREVSRAVAARTVDVVIAGLRIEAGKELTHGITSGHRSHTTLKD